MSYAVRTTRSSASLLGTPEVSLEQGRPCQDLAASIRQSQLPVSAVQAPAIRRRSPVPEMSTGDRLSEVTPPWLHAPGSAPTHDQSERWPASDPCVGNRDQAGSATPPDLIGQAGVHVVAGLQVVENTSPRLRGPVCRLRRTELASRLVSSLPDRFDDCEHRLEAASSPHTVIRLPTSVAAWHPESKTIASGDGQPRGSRSPDSPLDSQQ